MHALIESHWAAIKRILCYLKGTSSYDLHLTRGSSLSLHGLTDADWTRSVDDRKSTGGYIVFLGITVAPSSTKAEYKALADGTAKVF
jgi:histone deacetylase 1/2